MSDFQCNKKGTNWDNPKKGSEWLGDIISFYIVGWDKKATDDLI